MPMKPPTIAPAFIQLAKNVGHKRVEISVDTQSGEELAEILIRADDPTTVLDREALEHLGADEIQRASERLLLGRS